ncbi:protein phosphatase [Thermosporothrix hazakensis]|jgi:protein phosphatase|uniref:Protein phosphatase n=2 Tax=Thermosporothrix TaxID=768650 RepID=A0A326UNE2_THEHA|nr:PP2C family serine/threonine-protein phosphatase [Thermosporothrix hazakensis]PZW31275.1 protein phosphatase [Thermosporothrix hazakensis]BBH86501.1 protein-serine/threonine phosphatase [Thermosporothrix sp. COM3]GCE50811.1 protein-serine/threonine phosphatase [Thermosporothrix hazakensis]
MNQPEQATFLFTAHSVASDTHRERNEDQLIADQQRGFAAVFDGVGGSMGGEIASQIAARVIQEGWERLFTHWQTDATSPAPDDVTTRLRELLEQAHEQIRQDGLQRAGVQRLESQATTATIAALCPHADGYTLAYASVGDSRLYLLSPDQPLTCLTQDDSYLTLLLQKGYVTAEDAERIEQATSRDQLSDAEYLYFQRRNGITQALGDAQHLGVHTGTRELTPGMRLLLCTDGIHDNLTNQEIERILRDTEIAQAAQALVDAAIQRSRAENRVILRAKPDDMTAIVIDYHA